METHLLGVVVVVGRAILETAGELADTSDDLGLGPAEAEGRTLPLDLVKREVEDAREREYTFTHDPSVASRPTPSIYNPSIRYSKGIPAPTYLL